ncbi:MAG: PadR family transcriptional regulator [Chloroflexi bacterium]|nr:PadR family transcriptional regulator [Chloroflexota bacterium]
MNIKSNLPLTETTLFILLSLSPRAKHGYAIMKEVETLSNGRVRLSTGTLYGAIKRLLERGWIERVDEDEGKENGRSRKSYQLTTLGRHILKAETERLQSLLAAAQEAMAGAQA